MRTLLSLVSLVVLLAQCVAAQKRPMAFSEDGWILNGSGTRVAQVAGREALVMGTGSAVRMDLPVGDGTFEFDLRMPTVRSFVGIRFRMDAFGNAEEFYFRPHKGGQPDALQYAPVFGGESYWQVFHGPESTAAVEFAGSEEWLPVRVVVKGRRAAVFLRGEDTPVLISELVRDPTPGFFALYASYPNAAGSDAAAVSVSNFVVTPEAAPDAIPEARSGARPPAGIVRAWELSEVFPWTGGLPTTVPAEVLAADSWKAAHPDSSGVVVLGRFVARKAGAAASGVLARIRVHSATAQVKRLDLGFSDAAVVFLNGEILYGGDNRFSANFPRRQGLVTLDQAALFLPLRAGDNEIVVAVTDVMGGWAVAAAFADPSGLTIGSSIR